MNETVFDTPDYVRINEVRRQWLIGVLAALPFRDTLVTALDVGSGAGYFSDLLQRYGFRVRGLDLRADNVALCRLRYPTCDFTEVDLDDASAETIRGFGTHDLVLLFGLLYHLQSPLRLISRMEPCIGRIALVESRVAAGNGLASYLHREHTGRDQNLASVVEVPTLPALVSMFASVGFPHIYMFNLPVTHEQWDANRFHNGFRVQFVVSREPIDSPSFLRVTPQQPILKWAKIPQ